VGVVPNQRAKQRKQKLKVCKRMEKLTKQTKRKACMHATGMEQGKGVVGA